MATRHDPAPHGYDEDGVPKAPYGLNLDGSPRKSNRGARPGQRGNGDSRGTSKPKSSLTDAKRKEMLVSLADMLVVTPLAGLSVSPMLAKRLGPTQADALAGDAVIVSHFMPSTADALIVLSQTKPSVLSWLDTVEEKAPYLMLAQVGVQVIKAITENHMRPNAQLAQAGRTLVQMRMQQMAEQIAEEAAAMGIPTEVPHPQAA
jgi:hypothetical protein